VSSESVFFKLSSPDAVHNGGFMKDETSVVDFELEEQGPVTLDNGAIYEGQWKSGYPHGHGKLVELNGNTYEGQWRRATKHGQGKVARMDGTAYTGQYVNDKMHGEGTYHYDDGRIYKGQFVENMVEGWGVFEWPNGNRYEGEYVNDLKEGEGTYTWSNGNVYKGQWKSGFQHGVGTTIDRRGRTALTHWFRGDFLREVRQPRAESVTFSSSVLSSTESSSLWSESTRGTQTGEHRNETLLSSIETLDTPFTLSESGASGSVDLIMSETTTKVLPPTRYCR
jgi:hypothetical protein